MARVTKGLADFRAEVRALLFDVNGDAYTDARIDAGVKAGWARLCAINPVARYGANGMLREVAFTAAWDMEERWVRGLEYYAAAYCLEANIKDTVKLELSQALYAKADAVFGV